MWKDNNGGASRINWRQRTTLNKFSPPFPHFPTNLDNKDNNNKDNNNKDNDNEDSDNEATTARVCIRTIYFVLLPNDYST